MRKITSSAHRFFIGGSNFKAEFRRQMRFLIIVTLAFTIAFTWRQTVFDASQALVLLVTHVQSSTYASILTSIFITLVSIIIIYGTSKLLKDRPDYY